MSTLFESSFDALHGAMNMYLQRHNLIADNIANAETPGYKARRLEFESELQKIVEREQSGIAISDEEKASLYASLRPVVYEDPEAEVGADLNSVDMDREMAKLSENDVKYSAASQAVQKKFALLKYAISEGGK